MNNGSGKHPQLPRLFLWVIWIAMTQSVIIYGVVVKMGTKAERVNFESAKPEFGFIFSIIALVVIVIAFTLRFTILQRKPAMAQPVYIVILALTEIPGILGLVLGLQGTPLKDLYTYFGMSILAFAALSPVIIPKAEPNNLS